MKEEVIKNMGELVRLIIAMEVGAETNESLEKRYANYEKALHTCTVLIDQVRGLCPDDAKSIISTSDGAFPVLYDYTPQMIRTHRDDAGYVFISALEPKIGYIINTILIIASAPSVEASDDEVLNSPDTCEVAHDRKAVKLQCSEQKKKDSTSDHKAYASYAAQSLNDADAYSRMQDLLDAFRERAIYRITSVTWRGLASLDAYAHVQAYRKCPRTRGTLNKADIHLYANKWLTDTYRTMMTMDEIGDKLKVFHETGQLILTDQDADTIVQMIICTRR